MTTAPRRYALFIAAASVAALAGAYVFEYGMGLAPCDLCLYQRYPYVASAILGLAVASMARGHTSPRAFKRIGYLLVLTAALLLLDAGIAGYHVGIEEGWWRGPASCTSGGAGPVTFEELKAQILAARPVLCDVVPWSLFGISIAGYNGLFALGLAGIAAHGALRAMARR